MENLYGFFQDFEQFCSESPDSICLESGQLCREGRIVGQVPYIPVFTKAQGHASWVTYQDQRGLKIQDSWNGGSDYSLKSGEGTPDWVFYFATKMLQKK